MKKNILTTLLICLVLFETNIVNVLAETIYPNYTYTRVDDGKLFTDIAIGDNVSVVVGKNGRIYTYKNDILNCIETGSFEDFNQVEYNNDRFIVFSDDTVFQSITGTEWDVVSCDNYFQPNGLIVATKDNFIVEKMDGIYETSDFFSYNKISSASSTTNKYAANMQKYSESKEKNSIDLTRSYYEMIFGKNDSLDSGSFDKKMALFINLSGIEISSLPVNIDSIEFVEMSDTSLTLYYVKNFRLVKAETHDFSTWSEMIIDLPGQNTYLSGVIMGKMDGDFIVVYDTNDSAGIYKTKKFVRTEDMVNFQDVVITEVRGDIVAENGKIFILTSSSIHEVINSNVKTLIKEESILNGKKSIISTNNADFMWYRDDGIEVSWNKTGEWQEIEADNFITSHFIDGNANYQIIWTGSNYIVRPTDYDNGYNPTGVGGNIEVYDESFDHIKSATLNDYILQMSYVDGNCYVLTISGEIFYSNDFENWIKTEEIELPLSNGTTRIYKALTKSQQGYEYIHGIKGVVNKNIKKGVLYENWKGNKVDLSSDLYLRYDENIASFSSDGVYWKDIVLPNGLGNIQKVRIDNGRYVITTSEIELSYSIDADIETSKKIYVEIDDKILGFDVEPVIESDRTLVPLRFIFETLGAVVDWENATRTVIVQNEETTINFSIDNTTARVNSVDKVMDVPARLVNNKTMVPLRFLSEELGFNVEWDEGTHTITISK